jgi:DNA-binding MarR family transcriptional regulator
VLRAGQHRGGRVTPLGRPGPASTGGAREARAGGLATYAARVSDGGMTASAPDGTATADRAVTVTADAGPPTIDVTRLRVAIARVSRSLRRHELAGLTPTQLSALATVEQAGPVRLGDLAAAEKIAPSTLTRLVTVLEERGYVERHPVPGDARASTLAVTPDGHAILEQIRRESTILLADNLRTLSPDQLAALAAALPALERIADAKPLDTRHR